MWYIIIMFFLICFILTIWILSKDRLEGQRLGALEDFLELNLSPEKYTSYCIFYKIKKEDKQILINIDSSRREHFSVNDIMFLGVLKETGKTEVVFYPYGEKRIIVEETIESLNNKINERS